jgi:L-threonylcarbamoyladenylate synthase
MTAASLLATQPDDLLHQLRMGSAAMLPTDTLPALASLPEHARQIWRLKRRSLRKPLILMGAEPESLLAHVAPEVRTEAAALASDHWPGALTLVLPASGPTVQHLHPGAATLGLRIPDCTPTRHLLTLSGPLATTSINRSGEPAAQSDREATQSFPSLPLLGPLPWPEPSGQASTVLAWVGPGRWQLLREGAVMPTGLLLQPPCSG